MTRPRTAFTLIELLTTVSLLGLAASIVAPQLGSSRDWLLVPSAGRQVLADMLYVQNYAIATRQTVWVYSFTDPNGHTGYVAATFPSSATPIAPTYSQAIDPSGTGFVGLFVPKSGSPGTGQPPVSDRVITQFGAGSAPTRASGALAQTQMKSLTLDSGSGSGAPITAFGFDYSGQPIASTGPLVNNIRLTISSTTGTSPTSLYIHPISGEISCSTP